MNLIRLLAIIILLIVVYRLFFAGKRSPRKYTKSNQIKSLVSCTDCGALIPHHDAIRKGTDFYCCIKHRDKDNTA